MQADGTWEVHAVFHGRVQGVFFRANTVEIAEKIGLVGTVKNLPDGTVEVFAQGTKENLEAFVETLSGPTGPGYVNHVVTHYHPTAVPFSEFRIIY